MATEKVAKIQPEENVDFSDIHDRLHQLGSKLGLLADVDYGEISFGGAEGIRYFLREMASELSLCAEDVWNLRGSD
ncbi:hypothetical protein SAMN02745165_01896 [Malonomonas rubra DSM 5091]|uniref:Uncharacterized protein n=1 Tax=Malonomonas rubra DSM 5091 TaxID=1122189 RepID=A0A1M6HN93_MALRU|nr:hypothetical protein [Malonomonas rubra]SHJ23659.1 hypothetical protein SAMN02745165_01896 [Malonomonas rubra DSM 5091]